MKSFQKGKKIYCTDNNRWQTSNKVKLEKALAGTQFDITITGEKAQVIDGFGGCFSELGWDALMELSETERNKVIYNLFNPQEANFNYNRMPMGASDFGMNFYSFNDVQWIILALLVIVISFYDSSKLHKKKIPECTSLLLLGLPQLG